MQQFNNDICVSGLLSFFSFIYLFFERLGSFTKSYILTLNRNVEKSKSLSPFKKLSSLIFRRTWDHFREVPRVEDEEKPRKSLKFLQYFVCSVFGFMVFVLGFLSKSSLLLLITISSESSTTIASRPFGLLMLACTLVVPSVLIFLKSCWKITFKDSKSPSKLSFVWIVGVEFLVASGTAILTLVAMPFLDVITNVMILNSVCIFSAVLQVANCALTQEKNKLLIIPPIIAVILVLVGYVFLFIGYGIDNGPNSKQMYMYCGLAIWGTILVSLNWWENFATMFKIPFLDRIVVDIKHSRNFSYMISSIVRIVVTAIIIGAYVKLSGEDWSLVNKVPGQTVKVAVSLFAIQAISSALCHWFVVAACKMHALRRGFVLPSILISPGVLVAFLLAFVIRYELAQQVFGVINIDLPTYCQNFPLTSNYDQDTSVAESLVNDITQNLCNRGAFNRLNQGGLSVLVISAVVWWAGLLLSTLYVWLIPIHRIERTAKLFTRRLYESAFIDPSMLLNMRFQIPNKDDKNREEPVKIYLCATMWHETRDEMMKILISLFRLDKHSPKKGSNTNISFEAHIFFDDAFMEVEELGKKKRCVNEYAEDLVDVIKEVYTIFNSTNYLQEAGHQKIIQTPYGGRLCYTLPQENPLIIHFKDKEQIRHKKRWSQIMYLYYLLGWKLDRKYFDKLEMGEEENYLVEALKKEKHNTFILALDGDTDFQPSAVMLLVDRMRLYPDVGAACGRIHPTGTGPMVWYQKFEYAVGHWLQKTAEHVLGCVLCSPGCFSLFRGAALMDNNIMKTYTTKATEAIHYVQYDQGEDRWLCTLILQQGWRVEYNAASDAYTNAPQEFKEFYNQRRRWGPSTMANTIDLLGSGSQTVKINKSISTPYILYQVFCMGSSILGPATVCLMLAGSFSFVFGMEANWALVLAIVPPVIYMMLCFKLKSDTQINIAAFMSIFYAFLMSATILSIIGEMVKEQTFMTPSGLFFISMCILFIVTALLHPQEAPLIIYGVVYILSIPSGYLLLTIFSLVNMNNISWGTRETASKTEAKPAPTTKKHVAYEKTCTCCCWNIEK
ncbi:CHS6 synthase, partial [Amia calva]|nr:CHS6 synthase [Amia calva]